VNPLFEDNDGDGEIEIDDDKSMTMSLGAASSLQNIAEASAAASDGLGQKNFEVALKNNQSSERKSSMLTRIAIFLNFFFFFFFFVIILSKGIDGGAVPGSPSKFRVDHMRATTPTGPIDSTDHEIVLSDRLPIKRKTSRSSSLADGIFFLLTITKKDATNLLPCRICACKSHECLSASKHPRGRSAQHPEHACFLDGGGTGVAKFAHTNIARYVWLGFVQCPTHEHQLARAKIVCCFQSSTHNDRARRHPRGAERCRRYCPRCTASSPRPRMSEFNEIELIKQALVFLVCRGRTGTRCVSRRTGWWHQNLSCSDRVWYRDHLRSHVPRQALCVWGPQRHVPTRQAGQS